MLCKYILIYLFEGENIQKETDTRLNGPEKQTKKLSIYSLNIKPLYFLPNVIQLIF
jgi:hypothetical protein